MNLVERHYVNEPSQEMIQLCIYSKELYNKCNWYIRQNYFGKIILENPFYATTLINLVKEEIFYKNLHNTKTAGQTIRKLLQDWKNYFSAKTAYYLYPEKFEKKPKPPKYKKKYAQVIFTNETIRKKPLKQDIITPTNDLFKIKSDKKFKQVIVTPKTFGFIIEVSYKAERVEKTERKGIAAIDLGINNLCAITSDQHFPILVNGRIIKSINQYYNKEFKKEIKDKEKLLKNRYFKLENYFHHVSKFIINNCIKNNVGIIIIGKNIGWKESCISNNETNNQNFCYIAFNILIQKIIYKAELASIEVILTEESYTSKASFLDRDILPTYCAGETHTFSGRRVKRGLYKSKDGTLINADINGSANIFRKVIQDVDILNKLDSNIRRVSPLRINPLKIKLK